MKRTFWVVLPLVAFIALAALFMSRLGKNTEELPTALAGQSLPALALPTIEGGTPVMLTQLQGPLLLNVWATWCPSCYEELPYLLALRDRGVRIVGLDYKDDIGKAREFLATRGNPYQQVLLDTDGRVGLELGVYGAPETFIVDAQGIVRDRIAGVLTPENFAQKAAPVLGVTP